jgi:hypothetical protein
LKFLIPPNDKLFPIAYDTIEYIERNELNKYSDYHKSKVVLHTWLAWQEKSGLPFGQAITNRYLTTEDETCQKLVQWLKDLFDA